MAGRPARPKSVQGKTRGYRRHPQLERFQNHPTPQAAIGRYLLAVWEEAHRRGYSFKREKIRKGGKIRPLAVTRGQLRHEWRHLGKKLRRRDPARFKSMGKNRRILPHPSFRAVAGGVEHWERI